MDAKTGIKLSLRAILRVIQSLFLQLMLNYRIVREGVSQAKYRSLMMYFGLVVMFIVLSGWNSMIEPMTLRG